MAEQATSLLWSGTLPANAEQGVKTGLTLNTRDPNISITVTGKASNNGGTPDTGPEGVSGYTDPKALLPGKNVGAVLMQIGGGHAGGGPLTAVGAGMSDWKIRYDGDLKFFYNDVPGEFGNNSGSFNIAVLRQLKWSGTLPANAQGGVKTGIIVNTRTDKISITVTGKASYGPGGQEFGPDGNPNDTNNPGALLPSANCASCLMRIGNGPYRLVGTGKSDWAVPEDGEIGFFYNDGIFDDNSGSFAITLTVN